MKSEKTAKRRDRSRKKTQIGWPFERMNYLLFGLSLAIIIVGYVFMTQGPWDSFFSLTVAPIFLVIGYCVTLPMAILYRTKNQS